MLLMIPTAMGISSPGPRKPAKLIPIVVETTYVLETLTIYNPVEGQCDATPLITASNSRIDVDKLRNNEIRWMALSRDMLKRWNGAFKYGDTVMVRSGDESIDGMWVINDNMNKRFKNRGDLLFHRDTRSTGIWKNVKITRFDKKPVIG